MYSGCDVGTIAIILLSVSPLPQYQMFNEVVVAYNYKIEMNKSNYHTVDYQFDLY